MVADKDPYQSGKEEGRKSGSMTRLYQAVERARNGMAEFRENRVNDIRRIEGGAYNKGGEAPEESAGVNMMRFALYVYTRMFAPSNPQELLITRSAALKRPAKELELATNHTITGMNLARTIETAIMQSMTSIGCVKTGVTHASTYAIPDYSGDGYPYACSVDFDDLVFDIYARRWEELEFIGNFYRVPIEELKDEDLYDQDVVSKLQPSEQRAHSDTGEEKAAVVSRGQDGTSDEMFDYVDLCDLFVPRTGEFITCSADFPANLPPLRRAKWQGPPEGPYHLLYFYELDGQLMPLPPSAFWREMNDLIKNLFIKISNQALRQKQVGFADITNLTDAEKVRDAKDGEIVPTRNPGAVSQQSYGGVDNNTHAFVLSCMSIFNRLNWNIEVVAGVGPQSSTLGQDEMISAAANKQLDEMQKRVLKLVASVMRSISWCILTDPLADIPIEKTLDNFPEVRVQARYTPDSQAGSILDYSTEVHPFSWKITTPAARLAGINNFIQSVVMPLGQMMSQQGIAVDWKKFVSLWSEYSQLPELKDVVKFAPDGQIEPEDRALPKPMASKREYIRRNVKDTSPDADRQQLMQQLMSSGGGQGQQGGMAA